jgi:hypothetical protein
MNHREHAHDRWPIISLRDERSPSVQRDTPFGSADWNPRGGEDSDNARIARMVIEIRDQERDMAERDGRDWLGIGPRQYAYRLKARGFIFADPRRWKEGKPELTKDHFRSVERIVTRMRRDKRIDFDWSDVSDARGIEHVPQTYRDNDERLAVLAIVAARMRHVLLEGQKVVPELIVETEGLYNLIYDLADRYGAQARALQGQSAIAPRYELAQRVALRWKKGICTSVLSVADYDKHGDQILGAVAVDTAQHLRDMKIEPDDCLQFIRVALTQRQCDDHKIPLVEKDDRLVQEAEALPTDVLRTELEAACNARHGAVQSRREREAEGDRRIGAQDSTPTCLSDRRRFVSSSCVDGFHVDLHERAASLLT